MPRPLTRLRRALLLLALPALLALAACDAASDDDGATPLAPNTVTITGAGADGRDLAGAVTVFGARRDLGPLADSLEAALGADALGLRLGSFVTMIDVERDDQAAVVLLRLAEALPGEGPFGFANPLVPTLPASDDFVAVYVRSTDPLTTDDDYAAVSVRGDGAITRATDGVLEGDFGFDATNVQQPNPIAPGVRIEGRFEGRRPSAAQLALLRGLLDALADGDALRLEAARRAPSGRRVP
jgi:hypothetical protein